MPRTARSLCALLVAVVVCALASGASAAPATPSFQGRTIESLASYDGQKTCSPTVKPGTAALRSLVLASYSSTGDFGIVRDCAVGGVSEHKEGRAWDWRVNAFDPVQDAAAQDLFAWLLAPDSDGNSFALARRLGIMYMIYNGKSWSAYDAAAGWRPYTGANPHTDHVHISLSWAGAQKQTTYWTTLSGGAATGSTSTAAISARWVALGALDGPLGSPVGAEYAVPGGREQEFRGGRVLWSSATGAHGVWGLIGQRYTALGGPHGPLGLPTTDEQPAGTAGRVSSFQGGQVVWSAATGAHGVWGLIGQRYAALGGPGGVLGLPTTDEQDVPGGRASTFQAGRVLWSPATGAHGVWGLIGQRYTVLGGPAGPLGLPTTDEQPAGPAGRVSTFQGGQVAWSAATGAHAVWGLIGQRYAALGGPAGALGLPTADEQPAGAIGRVSVFSNGRVYWSAASGAWALTGPVLVNYLASGGATGPLGYPTGELAPDAGDVAQQPLTGGRIYLRGGAARHVRGAILDRYLALGGAAGGLGAPVSDEYAVAGGRRSDFDRGQLLWTAATGAVTG